jgi:ribosomal protein L9
LIAGNKKDKEAAEAEAEANSSESAGSLSKGETLINNSLRRKADKLRKEAATNAEKLAGVSIQVGAKAGESGKIFGSVTTIQIAEALLKAGFNVERKNIELSEGSGFDHTSQTINVGDNYMNVYLETAQLAVNMSDFKAIANANKIEYSIRFGQGSLEKIMLQDELFIFIDYYKNE